jgi:pyruvate formate lyase activating enzyme
MKPALLFEKSVNKRVTCHLCAHGCVIPPGGAGICRVRKNIDGTLYSLNYDKVAAINNDPIEKKPLYHFLPGSQSLSVATMGCNFRCQFCQNHSLSMIESEEQIVGENVAPSQLVNMAHKMNAQSISFTYTEPTIYFELMIETAKLAKKENLGTVMVTNGYMSAKALKEIAPHMDAANIDLKSFSDRFYNKYCGARLQPVLDTIREMKNRQIWIELTTLLIPDLNSSEEEIQGLIDFILEIGEDTPWHVSRFFPHHRMLDKKATNPAAIYSILELGRKKGLRYIFSGNTMGDDWTHTLCHNCQTLLVERSGYYTRVHNMVDGLCAKCNTRIPGVWPES